MYDNGLLQFYRERAYKDGILNLSEIPDIEEIEKLGDRIGLYSSSVGRFYKKVPRNYYSFHKAFDPEVLLGQIYAKAGLKSAIYLPVRTEGEVKNSLVYNSLFSNDVLQENTVVARDFLQPNKDGLKLDTQTDFLNAEHNGQSPILNFFTKKCLQQQIKMRVLDTACFNTDRHQNNFFYNVIQTKQEGENASPALQTDQGVVADEVVSIDYEYSGITSFHLMEHPIMKDRINRLYNDFSKDKLSRLDMFRQFSTNEQLTELIDKQALAEEVGSLDPIGVAEDIKHTIGYEVDSKYVQFLSESFDEVAEALIQ